MSQNQSPLPGQPHIAREGTMLMVEQVSLDALARQHGTPLFVYSRQWMLDALAAYQRGFEGRDALICYAMKANSSLGILRVFA
ncbi:MAG: diaminopimelate decarboxylase, partial [Proteobacteria bacterium]|nr:diaminopimelate decarboxylase [Pseudomonadota bacterium]